jgi:hypothetical protein
MPELQPGKEDKSFEELMADRTLNIFFIRILLKKNLQPLAKFISDRARYTGVDPLEIPQLNSILHDPILGPIHEIQQWRFRDKPYMFAFKGWRVGKFPQPNMDEMWRDYREIYSAILEHKQMGSGAVSIEELATLLDDLNTIYDEVAKDIEPALKKVWVENNIQKYEQWEGKTEGLPGALTPEHVDAQLRELRNYRQTLMTEPGGLQQYTSVNPPSMN